MRRFTIFLSLLLIAVSCLLSAGALRAEEPRREVLEAGKGLRWYKGNLHTHSLWSDGDDYLEMIAAWYVEHDYDFLSFTDHNVLANKERWVGIEKNKGGRKAFDKLLAKFPEWTETRMENDEEQVRLHTFVEVSEHFNEPGEFLLIQGEEISDSFERKPIHLNATNLQEVIGPRRGNSVRETIQNNVNALMTQRERTGEPMFIHLNHPNFGYAVTADDLARVVGERFFEVYNGHPGVHNNGDDSHPSTERIWDVVLTRRLAEFKLPLMFGLATDDGHNYHNIPSRASEPGRGWVEVLAKELTPAALIDAMEAGNFYSSSGVSLKSISFQDGQYSVEVDPAPGTRYTIEIIGTRKEFNPKNENEIGLVLETFHSHKATYEVRGDELYLRAQITADTPHPNPSELHDHEMAWTQPVVME